MKGSGKLFSEDALRRPKAQPRERRFRGNVRIGASGKNLGARGEVEEGRDEKTRKELESYSSAIWKHHLPKGGQWAAQVKKAKT